MLEVLDGFFVLLDDLLTEVRTLGKLFLNFIVEQMVFVKGFNFSSHGSILVDQVLSLL